MKYFLFTLSLLLMQANAQEKNRCYTEDGDIKLYSPQVIDLSRGQTVTFGRCADVFMGAENIVGYRVHYQKNPEKIIYVDLDVTSGLGFGYANYQEIISHIDIGSTIGRNLSGDTFKLIFREKFEDSPADSDYIIKKEFDVTTKKSVSNAITDPTGAWYAPALDGTGFVLMQVAGGSVMYYYGYDKDGKRLWLISEVINETWVKGEAKNLVMYEGQADANTNFTTPPANQPGTVVWGNVDMRFDGCNKGYAKLDGVDGEQTFDLVKLAVPSAVHCSDK